MHEMKKTEKSSDFRKKFEQTLGGGGRKDKKIKKGKPNRGEDVNKEETGKIKRYKSN